jgi:flagellar motor protein MotB
MKAADCSPMRWSPPQPDKEKAKVILEMDMHAPLVMTNVGVVADHQPKSLFSAPRDYRLTLSNMENLSLKSQPAPIHWAVGWADLMMTMFVLFLVMYLYQSAQHRELATHGPASPLAKATHQVQSVQGDRTTQEYAKSGNDHRSDIPPQAAEGQNKGNNPLDAHPDHSKMEMTKLYDLAILTLKDKDLAKFADIELSPDRTVHIVLAADLLFSSGYADLASPARERIRKIASLLKKTPYRINVSGHTDNVPIRSGPYATNWELSVMRATTVARFLIEEMDIPAAQLSVTGHSHYQPLTDNETYANRAKNRRVEIIVSREQQPAISITSNSSLL